VVAVASDGSAFVDRGIPLTSVLRQEATLIQDLAGLSTRVISLDPDGSQRIQEVLDHLPSEVGAVFLTHTESHRALEAQSAVSRPVVTDQDTTAIALSVALLTTLGRRGRAPQASRVVIAGAQSMPILCPLLMVAGLGDITSWNPGDAVAFPLHRIAAGTDAVIDVVGATNLSGSSATAAEPAVITPDEAVHSLLALPGLLRVLTQIPNAQLDVEVYLTCALALVMATPPDEDLPHSDHALADRIVDAVATALQQIEPPNGNDLGPYEVL
jgi:malate dehydrogenase (oxaloacetate-decarboxylating)